MKWFTYMMFGLLADAFILGTFFFCHHDLMIHFGLLGLLLICYVIPLILDSKYDLKWFET